MTLAFAEREARERKGKGQSCGTHTRHNTRPRAATFFFMIKSVTGKWWEDAVVSGACIASFDYCSVPTTFKGLDSEEPSKCFKKSEYIATDSHVVLLEPCYDVCVF